MTASISGTLIAYVLPDSPRWPLVGTVEADSFREAAARIVSEKCTIELFNAWRGCAVYIADVDDKIIYVERCADADHRPAPQPQPS